jgi:hypothetical protein
MSSHDSQSRAYCCARVLKSQSFSSGVRSEGGLCRSVTSEIHAQAIHDVNVPPPLITADILRLLHTDYMGHDCVDEALGEIGDRLLIAEVNRYHRLERKHKSFQESITRLEDQLFTNDVERRMCVS